VDVLQSMVNILISLCLTTFRLSPKLTRKLSVLVEEDDVLSDTDGVPTPKMTSGQGFSAFYHTNTEFSPHAKKRNNYSTDYER